VAEANGADVADGYQAFQQKASEAGGDSVEAGLVLPNDVHPSAQGQQLLADAVTAVVGECFPTHPPRPAPGKHRT